MDHYLSRKEKKTSSRCDYRRLTEKQLPRCNFVRLGLVPRHLGSSSTPLSLPFSNRHVFLHQISTNACFHQIHLNGSLCRNLSISSRSSRLSLAKPTEYEHIPNPSDQQLTSPKVQELLSTAAAAVKSNEPGVLRYSVQREVQGDAPVLIMLET